MSVTTTTPIPAGWYPDPRTDAQQRWWDGDAWTRHVAPYEASAQHTPLDEYAASSADADRVSAPTQLAALPSYNAISAYGAAQAYTSEPTFAAAASPVRAEGPLQPVVGTVHADRAQAASGSPMSSSFQSEYSAVPYQPFGMVPRAQAGIQPKRTQRFTVWVWLFALTPLAYAGASIAISHRPTDLDSRFTQGGLAALAIAAMLLLAILDRKGLRMAGHLRTASPLWMLLTPFGYLAARAVVVRKQTGFGASSPLVISILVCVAIALFLVLQPATLALVLAASQS